MKLEVYHQFFHVVRVRRLIVVDLIDELVELVDVVIDCGFLIFLEICEVIGSVDVFEVRRATVFITELLSNSGNIILDTV